MQPGQRLGQYEILSSIGAGAMGEVYRAKDHRLGREVALKLVASTVERTAESTRRFEQEARALAALNHPHVAVIHGFEESDGRQFLVMELVDGEPLDRRLARGPLPRADALAWGAQIADALDAAHRAGIIHRDLKPSNIILSARGVKLLDFGVSKLLKADAPDATTSAGTAIGQVVGTAPYMSPEQMSGKPVDQRTDAWSFGCVLYEMLTGTRAFAGDSFATTAAAVLTTEPDWRRLPADVPAPGRDALRRCLVKNPQERPASLGDVSQVLRRREEHPPRRGRLAAAIVAAVALLALVGGWLLTRDHGRSNITAIAVLPLESDSQDPSQAYFVDGMTDALINDLSALGLWKVISRTSVMGYRNHPGPLSRIAQELGVNAVVEGSVLQAGSTVRISARLIDAATERPLWADTYEREVKDILSLQREVARAIAHEIEGRLAPEVDRRLAADREVNPEAHLLYMKGRHLWNERSPASLQEAIRHFERALERDPEYAPALAGLAESYVLLPAPGGGKTRPSEAFPIAIEKGRHAIRLDPSLAGAHAALGYAALLWQWDWTTAEREFHQAIRLNPNYANAYFWYAAGLASRGRMDEALARAKTAVDLDPVSPIITAGLAWMHHFARDDDATIAVVKPVLELNPRFRLLHHRIAVAYRRKGLYKGAIAHHQQAVAASDRNPDVLAELAASYAAAGQSSEARRLLAEIQKRSAQEYVSAYAYALVHTFLGEQPQALMWLEKATDERSWYLPFIAVEPDLESLRGDPRFQKVLKTVNLEGVVRAR